MLACDLRTRVELSISCTDLRDKDVFSKSDPLCALSMLNQKTKQWDEIDRTERIKNNLNPKFSRKIQMDYFFEQIQRLRFDIYDIDNSTNTLNDDDFLGRFECNLGRIVSKQTFKSALKYNKNKPAGKGVIIVEAKEIQEDQVISNTSTVTLEFNGQTRHETIQDENVFNKSLARLESKENKLITQEAVEEVMVQSTTAELLSQERKVEEKEEIEKVVQNTSATSLTSATFTSQERKHVRKEIVKELSNTSNTSFESIQQSLDKEVNVKKALDNRSVSLESKNQKQSERIKSYKMSDKRSVTFEWKGHKLDKKDTFGKSDPFMELWKSNNNGTWSKIHKTEVKKNTLNPKWKPFSLSVHSLCDGDFERQIKIVISDADSDGKHDLIGEFYSSLKELLSRKCLEFQVINHKKKAKKSSYKNSGIAILEECTISTCYTFLDYIFAGLELNFTVGIDFTGSNGKPSDPNSLHFMNPKYPNDYLQALTAVGTIIQDYDSDKLFPALGFGAKIPPKNELSFEFPLNFSPENPYCDGIQGIVDAYKNALPQIKLWGPTNVAPIINHVARFAAQAQAKETFPQNYFVLLLLTDGIITDFDDTVEAIVNASFLPMSIIIVGVGSADFSEMRMLDGDDDKLKTLEGVPVARDIVQFVPYNKFKQTNSDRDLVSVALAKEVLAEIPTQITKYYSWKNMVPGKRLQAIKSY